MLCATTTQNEVDALSLESVYLMIPYVSKPVFLFGIGQVKVDRLEVVAGEEKVCECECRKRRNVALLKVTVKS